MNRNLRNGFLLRKRSKAMNCSFKSCTGQYEERQILHTVRYKGQVIVIDNVPAEVCSYCGDMLLKPETVRRIEELLKTKLEPSSSAPVYQFA